MKMYTGNHLNLQVDTFKQKSQSHLYTKQCDVVAETHLGRKDFILFCLLVLTETDPLVSTPTLKGG